MCEEEAPVKALNFLQSEVSSVVDHNSPREAEMFRSLLTHLLAPRPTSSSLEPTAIPTHDAMPSRKRSQSNFPDEGTWTDKLDDDYSTPSPTSVELAPVRTVSARSLRAAEDPIEHTNRGDATGELSEARFSERSEVFEGLLEFVPEDVKQPSESLLDFIDGDEGSV